MFVFSRFVVPSNLVILVALWQLIQLSATLLYHSSRYSLTRHFHSVYDFIFGNFIHVQNLLTASAQSYMPATGTIRKQVILSRLTTKPTKWPVRPAKTQISLGTRPVWPESSLCAQRIVKGPSYLRADSEDSEQIGRMPRLIWVFAGRTVILLVLSWGGSIMFKGTAFYTPIIIRLRYGVLGDMLNSVLSGPYHCLFIYVLDHILILGIVFIYSIFSLNRNMISCPRT